MGKVVIHTDADIEKIKLERARRIRDLPFDEKLRRLFSLIRLSVLLNNGEPLKKPLGKGLIIRKPASC